MPAIPRQPLPASRSRAAGIRRPSPTPRSNPAPQLEQDAGREDAPVKDRVPATRRTKPSPRPKNRDQGAAKPVELEVAEASVAEPEPRPRPRAGRRPRNNFVLAGVLLAVALVLIGLAVWFKIEDNRLDAATSNKALLDVAATSQVNQAATSAVETLFSYDYNNIAKTQNAAKDLLLNDDVRNKYNSLMGEVERLAPQQKMVVTVKASRSAVLMLNGDQARVMVFVDQTATRTDINQTNSGSAQLWVNMQFSGGKWKIIGLDTYSPEQPPASPPAPAPASPAPSK